MRMICKICRKGESEKNEDTYGISGNYAWVIDGCTDVFRREAFGVENEVTWYVRELSQQIKKCCVHGGDLKEILFQAISKVRERLPETSLARYQEYELPTFAISFIKWTGMNLEYCILGDCCLGIIEENGPRIIIDHRLAEFTRRNREKVRQYIKEKGTRPERKELFWETRSKANSVDGYPIGSVYGSGVSKAVTGNIDMEPGGRILIFSDGALDYIKTHLDRLHCFYDEKLFFDEVNRLYAYMKNEQYFNEEPRPKKIDDCTMLLVEV